jgi:deazaflavin-dependent oxidoreductase (nitroreductase family)
MAYRRPPLFTRVVFNPLALRLGISGAAPLTVAGRKTGRPRTVPVIPLEQDGVRYLVSPRGETDWVRNLRASGRGELGGRPFRAVEVPVTERGPLLGAYRRLAGRAVAAHFDALPNPADHPVFRLGPG